MDGIIETSLPIGWKNLTLDKYDDIIDLDEHVDAYITQGVTLNWYTRLPPNSTNSFKTLMNKFGAQYATSYPHHLTLVALEKDESLHSFIKRFVVVAIKTRDLNLEIALHLTIMALKSGLFLKSLCTPVLMDELRTRASGYIQMEEMVEHQAVKNHRWEKGASNQPVKRKNKGERDS
ncbi:hypothetical protein CR513_39993, partial [Mucuna pruriens]